MDIAVCTMKEQLELIDLWVEKARWLEENGYATWDISQFSIEGLKTKYDDPVYFICREGSATIGGFILIEYDRRYWPEQRENDAYYLHKFLVCNEFSGKGYSSRILDWIKEYARKNRKGYVRLDYDSDREKIDRIYKSNGFVPVEILDDGPNQRTTKAEFRVGS